MRKQTDPVLKIHITLPGLEILIENQAVISWVFFLGRRGDIQPSLRVINRYYSTHMPRDLNLNMTMKSQ